MCVSHCVSVMLTRLDTQSEKAQVSRGPVDQESSECNKELGISRWINRVSGRQNFVHANSISEISKIFNVFITVTLQM
jgi:hypothetical protein